jgi:hypothetical protein
MTRASGRRAHGERRLLWGLFVLMLCLILLTTGRGLPGADGGAVYHTTKSLVEHHTFGVPQSPMLGFWFVPHNGALYSFYPLGLVFAMIPGYALYRLCTWFDLFPGDGFEALTTHLAPALIGAAIAVTLFRAARRMGATRRESLALAVAVDTLTILAVYNRIAYSESLQALAVLWLTERGLALGERITRRGMLAGGTACGLALCAKHVLVIEIPIVLAYVLYQQRARLRATVMQLGWALLAFAPFVVATLWHNHIKTGSVWNTGYGTLVATPDFAILGRLHAFCFSPSKSLFLFSPFLLLWFPAIRHQLARDRARGLFLLTATLALVLIYAAGSYWHGDWAWGPRYLVPIVPGMVLTFAGWVGPALTRGRVRVRRGAVTTLVATSFAVQLVGAGINMFVSGGERRCLGPYPNWLTRTVPVASTLSLNLWTEYGILTGRDLSQLAVPGHAEGALPRCPAAGHVGFDWWALELLPEHTPATVVVLALLSLGALWGLGRAARELRAADADLAVGSPEATQAAFGAS